METTYTCLLLLSALWSVSSAFDAMAMQRTKCITSCPDRNKLVCGSDEQTYLSPCHLSKAACEQRKSIRIAHPGECGCPLSCNKNYRPVCGAYKGVEKTFINECRFKKERCRIKDAVQALEFKRLGPCKPMLSWRNCPQNCRDMYNPVCGEDDISYSSVCALKSVACRRRKKIKLSSIGRCGEQVKKCPEFCPFNYRPICGNDGILYPSECEMKLTACKAGKVVLRATKDQKKACKKKCVVYCPDVEEPVCVDNATYLNLCTAKKAYCAKGKFLKNKRVKQGRCGKMNNNLPIKSKK